MEIGGGIVHLRKTLVRSRILQISHVVVRLLVSGKYQQIGGD